MKRLLGSLLKVSESGKLPNPIFYSVTSRHRGTICFRYAFHSLKIWNRRFEVCPSGRANFDPNVRPYSRR